MLHARAEFLHPRHAALRAALEARGLDVLVVTHLPNVAYLTNFNGSAAIAVVDAQRVSLITDSRYLTAAQELIESEYGGAGIVLVPVEQTYDETLVALLTRRGARRIGFEAAHLSVSRHIWLERSLGRGETSSSELVATERDVERLRVRKDRHELDTLRAAAALLSEVAGRVLREVRVGQTERELAAQIDWHLVRGGFERPAFETIVASGPNSALPHARPTARHLTPGDLVVLDFGGVYDGYCVDLTRMVSVGEPADEARRVHEAVAAAHAAAVAATSPGVAPHAIDGAARQTLFERGLGERFGHGTGHGLGLEIHEEPRIGVRRSGDTDGIAAVESGMVFTIEPGAYLPGWGGVRIEDDVLVTPNGVEVLTTVPRDLVIVQ